MNTIGKTVWFALFGSIPCLMVLVSQPWQTSLALYMAYCLGGLAVLALNTASKKTNDPMVIRGLNLK